MQLKAPSQLTKLERSIASVDTGAFRNDSTQPVAAFIRGIGLSLRDIIDGMDSGDLQDRKVRAHS